MKSISNFYLLKKKEKQLWWRNISFLIFKIFPSKVDGWCNVACEMNGGSNQGNLGSETYFVKQQCNLSNLGTDLNALSSLCYVLKQCPDTSFTYIQKWREPLFYSHFDSCLQRLSPPLLLWSIHRLAGLWWCKMKAWLKSFLLSKNLQPVRFASRPN